MIMCGFCKHKIPLEDMIWDASRPNEPCNILYVDVGKKEVSVDYRVKCPGCKRKLIVSECYSSTENTWGPEMVLLEEEE